MSYLDTVKGLADEPERLEQTYQAAVKAGRADAFREAIDANLAAAPDDKLLAAWFYRLNYAAGKARESFIAWGWAIPLGLLNGLVLWFLSDEERFGLQIAGVRGGSMGGNYGLPMVLLLAAPITATFVLLYLAGAGRKRWGLAALISVVLLAVGAYVIWVYPQAGTRPYQEQYLTLMAMHLPLLAWAGVGLYLIFGHRDATNRFAFLLKSLEVIVMGGLFAIAGGIFTGITVGLFDALSITLPTVVIRLFVAGGGGLIAVIAVAIIYNARIQPAGQEFDEGLSRLVSMLLRVLLPLTALVLLVYMAFIPANFREPFENRDVLIIYNAMLFAVIALMVGATPVSQAHLSPRLGQWLRRGIITVAVLAGLISLYALAAILYRTAIDRLTPNRLTFIGWNIVNIGLLLLVIFYQVRAKEGQWVQGLHRAFALGTVAYTIWTLAMILVLPWLFRIDQTKIESLPQTIQAIIYEQPDPVLLKCIGSPHIYLLDDGEKRWIDTIATFTDRGYVWRDVQLLPRCDDLRAIPDGEPIPADAGPPPQP